MKTKICSRCKIELPITDFCKGNDKDDLNYHCKNCQNKYYKIHHKPIIKKKKICLICKKDFIPPGNHQKFCSKECGLIGNKKQRKNHRLTPNVILSIIKQNIIRRNIELNITKEDFINWYNSQVKTCHYCKRTLEEINCDIKEKRCKNRLSIDRKNNNKGYVLNNIVLACYRCNTIKGEYFTEQEMLRIGKTIYQK